MEMTALSYHSHSTLAELSPNYALGQQDLPSQQRQIFPYNQNGQVLKAISTTGEGKPKLLKVVS